MGTFPPERRVPPAGYRRRYVDQRLAPRSGAINSKAGGKGFFMPNAAVSLGSLFPTGGVNPQSGRFDFAGYLDGSWHPAPLPTERTIPLAKGNIFPPIRSAGRGCYWRLTELL